MAGVKWSEQNMGDRIIWHYCSNPSAKVWYEKTVWDIVSPNQGYFEHREPEYANSIRILQISGYSGRKHKTPVIEVVLWSKKPYITASDENIKEKLPKYVMEKVESILAQSWSDYKAGRRLP